MACSCAVWINFISYFPTNPNPILLNFYINDKKDDKIRGIIMPTLLLLGTALERILYACKPKNDLNDFFQLYIL